MGKVIMSGIVPQLVAPATGIKASDLAVGSTVKLMESSSPVEYLVVHNGLPSSMYDSSCNGLWLLRKAIYTNQKWHSSNNNIYGSSTIHSYLNSTFFGVLGALEQTVIKQVKIPYVNGQGSAGQIASGANGLSTKIFLLAGCEVGFTSFEPVDGSRLSYFNSNTSTTRDSKRVAYLNGSATHWYLRSPYSRNASSAWAVLNDGSGSYGGCSNAHGVRPALILPSTALFDEETLLLKGVS